MELIKHTNSVNFYSNVEKIKDQSQKGGLLTLCINQAVF